MLTKPTISLHGNDESVTLGNRDTGSFILSQGATGLGWGPHELTTAALAGGGSVLRHRRLAEADVMIPIVLSADDFYQRRDDRRTLEQLCADRVEIRVEHPDGWSRSRWGYLKDGLEGSYGSGEDSHNGQKLVLTFLCPDPMWYGQERVLTQRVDAARKPFITSKLSEPAVGAVVHREDRAPTASDAGTDGDVWFVGKHGRDEVVEATNLVFNPSFEVSPSDLTLSSGLASATQSSNAGGVIAGDYCLEVTGAASGIDGNTAQIALYTPPGVSEGDYLGWGWSLATSESLTVSVGVNWYNSGGSFISSEYQSYRAVPTSLERMSSAFLAPAGTYRARMIIRFRAANGTSPAPANFKVLTDGWSAVPAQSEQSALTAVDTFFDGDTENGTGPDDPHYRWTGEPHASPSEKYLPATEFKPTDRYVHNGTEWEQVGLEKRAPFLPIVLASSTVDGAYQLNIQGDAEAWPIWEIDGPGEDLLIENVRTGERIFIEGEFGETVTIDTKSGDIFSDTFTQGELWDRVSLDSVLSPLTPGQNRIKITMVNARPNSEVRLRYRETYRAGH